MTKRPWMSDIRRRIEKKQMKRQKDNVGKGRK